MKATLTSTTIDNIVDDDDDPLLLCMKCRVVRNFFCETPKKRKPPDDNEPAQANGPKQSDTRRSAD